MQIIQYPIKVLYVDDQKIALKAMEENLKSEKDIFFRECIDPTQAIAAAVEYEPTVILLDLVMDRLDGMLLLRYLRANPHLKQIPIIVFSVKEDPQAKVEAFALGANDYLVKFPSNDELIARIRYHSKSYIRLLERNDAYLKLQENEKRLANELQAAANYICTLLPKPLSEPVQIDYRYLPSSLVGGDSFGYKWLTADELCFYLIDVSGSGVKAALHSCSILHTIHQAIEKNDTVIRKPDLMAKALNEEFPMEEHDNTFFTLWYGLYDRRAKKLTYISCGAPPAILSPEGKRLESDYMPLGTDKKAQFKSSTLQIPAKSSIFLASDGVYEIEKRDGTVGCFEDFFKVVMQPPIAGISELDRIQNWSSHIAGGKPFADDWCLIHITL